MHRIRQGALHPVFSTLTAFALSASLSCTPAATQPVPEKRFEPPVAAPVATQVTPTVDQQLTRANAHHLLSRFSFGPTLRVLESAEQASARDWLTWQLGPDAIADSFAETQVYPYRSVLLPPNELRQHYSKTVIERFKPRVVEKRVFNERLLLRHAQTVQYVRQTTSSRQVLEVMVDFWFNHFNVYAKKAHTSLLITDYIENAIRPHALGRFEDVLLATARHPAMLTYLDNYQSSVPRGNDAKAGKKRTPKGGITENYARELLELHTLGVHGGYTQDDVVSVARILTGWTLADTKHDHYSFAFKPELHDTGAKSVLGVQFPAGGGQEEGERLLELLAHHPSTARHLASRLCARFVADNPPPSCVTRVSDTFERTGGEIKAMVLSIVEGDDFWSPENRLSKLKAPLHFMISAHRALDLRVRPKIVEEWSRNFGQPLLLQPAPTGYPVEGAAWVSTADSLNRMTFASTLGAQVFKKPEYADVEDDTAFVDRLRGEVFTGPVSKQTEDAIFAVLAQKRKSSYKRRLAIALALGSPEFQHF